MGGKGMLQDIWDTPKVYEEMVARHLGMGNSLVFPTLEKQLPAEHKFAGQNAFDVLKGLSMDGDNEGNRIIIVGSGSSWHASILAEYLIETIARCPVEVQYASEFRYRSLVTRPGDVLIVVSNLGETADTIECLRLVKASVHGSDILTIAIGNSADSTLARESDFFLDVQAGKEQGITATKAFSATGLAFLLLSVKLGQRCGTLKEEDCKAILDAVQQLPAQATDVITNQSKPLCPGGDIVTAQAANEFTLWDISCQNVLAANFIFLGRGFNFPIALEGAVKCKEVAYIHAEGYAAAEMKHGPIALIDAFMPVVVIALRADPCYDKIKSNLEEVKTRHGSIIVITESDNPDIPVMETYLEHIIKLPKTHEYLMPMLSVLPVQILAFMMGIMRGNEVDQPRGLQKCMSQDVCKLSHSQSQEEELGKKQLSVFGRLRILLNTATSRVR